MPVFGSWKRWIEPETLLEIDERICFIAHL